MTRALAFLMVILGFLMIAAIPSHDPSVRKEVDHYINRMSLEVNTADGTAGRYRALNRALDAIRMVRENGPPQSQTDDGQMDLVVNVLESIPPEQNFKKKDCAKYENDFINQFEPTAEDAPEDPSIKPGWTVLHALCK